MAIIPFAQLVGGTARIAAAEGIAALVGNALLDSFCNDSDNYEEWDALTRSGLEGAVARRVNPLTRMLRNQYCPNRPPPRQPLSIQPPLYGVGGASQGQTRGYNYRINPDGSINTFAPRGEIWICSSNRGLPVTGVREIPLGNGIDFVNSIRLRRANGTEFEQAVSGTASNAQNNRNYVVEIIDIRPCDPAIVPIIPPGVQLDPPPPGTPVPIRPEFPITISIPQLPGMPPIVVPIVYAPIQPTLSLEPRISLRPSVQLPGFPNFAPDIDIDLGGISISGGGDLTISDVEEIINEADIGGDCPDPCEPVDYAAIAQIVFEELDLKFPPGRPVGTGFTTYEAANSREVVLPDFPVSVDISVTERSPDITVFSGGSSAPAVTLIGWYSFGDNTTTGERLPISYELSSILVPKGARGFSYTLKGESLATVRVNFLTGTEPP